MNIGDIINDRYLLVRSIGRGSFGEVWLATDQKLGLDVAIKIYIALDTRGITEFKNEFKSVYNLHHPNLLRADYFDSFGSNPYLVMPYCPESVGNKVGNMSEPEIWEFIKGVASGLAYLHANDVIHRDIKPDNILIDEQGNYVITDFGLSTKMRSTLRKASARQNEGNQSGTIGYMAPEMFSSKPEAVKATDIWALGATIYEMATGEMSFCGQGGVMELHGAELPELPEQFSPKLTELMTRCLAKDPWDRPTAQNIADSLQSQLREPPTYRDGATGKTMPAATAVKQNNIFKPLFWAALVLFVLSTAFFIWRIDDLINDYNDQLWEANNNLYNANEAINNIENIAFNGATTPPTYFADWTSTNHDHNTRDYKQYDFMGYEGDELSFDYAVDSESFDHFKASISHYGTTEELRDVSGLGKYGSVTYRLPGNGPYTLLIEYNKDHSIHSGRDNSQVSNIMLERSIMGAIIQELNHYEAIRVPYEYGDTAVVAEEVVEWEDE